VTFAYVTGWRVDSEVLPLQWRHVDFGAGEIRLDPGTTKNGEGRMFPMTATFARCLSASGQLRNGCSAKENSAHMSSVEMKSRFARSESLSRVLSGKQGVQDDCSTI